MRVGPEQACKVGQTKKRSFPSHGYPVSFPCRKPLMRQAFCALGASWISAGALKNSRQNSLAKHHLVLSRPCELYLGARGILLRAGTNLGSDSEQRNESLAFVRH